MRPTKMTHGLVLARLAHANGDIVILMRDERRRREDDVPYIHGWQADSAQTMVEGHDLCFGRGVTDAALTFGDGGNRERRVWAADAMEDSSGTPLCVCASSKVSVGEQMRL